MTRQRSCIVSIVMVLVLILVFIPVGEGRYFGRDVGSSSCGDTFSCHGPEKEDLRVVVTGPDEVGVNEVIPYSVTILDGPGMIYGFYSVVERPDGKFQDISGNPLVVLTTNQIGNTSHDAPLSTNHFILNFTAPKYAGEFKLFIVVLSSNGDGKSNQVNDSLSNIDSISEDGLNWTKGNSAGSMDGQTVEFSDEWVVIEKDIKVNFPERGQNPRIFWFGCGASLFVVLTMLLFIIQKKRG